MRCFFGLPLPERYQQRLDDLTKYWKPRLRSKVSWTKPGNWHLTLKFLDDLQPKELKPLLHLFQDSLGQMFILQGQGGGFFPHSSRPRVIWVGVGQGASSAQDLAGEIDRRCALQSIAPEVRPFMPHLTVARIRQAMADSWPEISAHMHAISWPEISMDRVLLWQSHLTSKGPYYQQLAEFELPGEAMGLSPSAYK